jgi:hypothetical protein
VLEETELAVLMVDLPEYGLKAGDVGTLGRIDRRAASHADRARSTVSKRIRFAIRQIEKSSPALGGHLSKAIRTGYDCIYQPTETIGWHF